MFGAEKAVSALMSQLSIMPMLLSLMGQKNSPNTATTFNKEYDFVIVGAGSAGSVVARRLSEVPCFSVLLLEAGGPPPELTEIPAINRLFFKSEIDWAYKTVPQKNTGNGLKNRQIDWTSGKALGGSSVLNDIVYSRGNKKNYDDWAAQGADGWSYNDVLPFFIKLEDNRDPEYVADGYHGTNGPQTVAKPNYTSEMKGPIFEAAKDMGYRVVDPNGPTQSGFYDLQGIIRGGQLCSTAKGYLVPADDRDNLDILPKATGRKVLIENGRATGVEFDYKGSTHQVKARREVIMSAGTVNSPKLLMLSGIGPKEVLKKFKIPVIADLPVGQNLQDHVGASVDFLLSKEIPEVSKKLVDPKNIARYIHNRTGVLSAAQLISAVAFLEKEGPDAQVDFPDFAMYLVELSTVLPALEFNMKPKVFKQVYGPYQGHSYYSCLVHLLHPRSRGTVTLRSTDPHDSPVIDPNYFDVPGDLQDLVAGMKMCYRLGTSDAMQKVKSTPFATKYPGCEKYVGDEDKYFACQAKSVALSFYHSVGTCKMGQPNDPTTVVDPQLRVKGIDGLRVIDASIMPTIPTGTTNIPTIMIAEKASQMMKDTIQCEDSDCR